MILRFHLLDPDVSTSHYTRVGNNNRIEDHQVCQDSWDETSMKDLREVSWCNHQHNHLLVPNIPVIKIKLEIVSTRILESSSYWLMCTSDTTWLLWRRVWQKLHLKSGWNSSENLTTLPGSSFLQFTKNIKSKQCCWSITCKYNFANDWNHLMNRCEEILTELDLILESSSELRLPWQLHY